MFALFHSRRPRLALVLAVALFVLLIVLGSLVILHGRQVLERQLRDRLRDIAAVSAQRFDADLVQQIRYERDQGNPVLQDIVVELQAILDEVPALNSTYILRRTEHPTKLAFVADASMDDTIEQLDTDRSGIVEPREKSPKVGQLYDAVNLHAMRVQAFEGPATDAEITVDQWGASISGYAPIRSGAAGKTVAILGVDMDADLFLAQSKDLFMEYVFFFVIVGAMSIASAVILLYRENAMQMMEETRRGMLLIATHQLGEPLTIIRNSAEMLMDSIEAPDLRQVVSEHVDMLQEGIKRMDSVFVHLKEASVVEKNAMKVTMGPVDMRDVLQDVVVATREMQEKRKQNVSVQVEGQVVASSDRYLLRRALSELIDNALSFSREGSEVHVLAYAEDDHVIIKVQDHGCGIPKDDLHRIFEKFGRASNAATMKPGGYGLGLFVVRGIIVRLGGDIRVRSEQGDGSVFTIDLPAHGTERRGLRSAIGAFLRALSKRLLH